MAENDRRRSRIPFRARALLRFDGHTVEGSTQDLTMEGLFVGCDEPPAEGAECDIDIRLTSGADELPIRGRGRVVRHCRDPLGVGIEFTAFEPGSEETLWRVVRYNSPTDADG